jgi:hypothetical protein
MAFAVTIRFGILDNKGKTSFTKVRIPTGFSITDMVEFAQSAAQLIADLSGGQVTSAGVCAGLDLSSATIKPVVISQAADTLKKGFFQFKAALDARFKMRMKIPAFSETKIVAGSDQIDQTDTDVAAFITAMEDGIAVTSATIQPTTNRANDLDTIDFARELFRAS